LVEKFTQQFDMEESDPSRYRVLYDGLASMILKHKPVALALERSMGAGLMFVRNNLSETVGVAKLCCHDSGTKVYEVSPSHLKKIITGHGSAKKKSVKANIAATFGLAKSGVEHECDAAACALVMLVDLGWTGYVVKVPFSKSP
jgi:crossover junction endodeoxyribonuclease RuvC